MMELSKYFHREKSASATPGYPFPKSELALEIVLLVPFFIRGSRK